MGLVWFFWIRRNRRASTLQGAGYISAAVVSGKEQGEHNYELSNETPSAEMYSDNVGHYQADTPRHELPTHY